MSSRKAPDIIRWVIDCMLAHDDSISEELALAVEREARAEWGGQSISYIAKRCAADHVDPAIVRSEFQATGAVDDVTKRHGISRAHLYRLLRRS